MSSTKIQIQVHYQCDEDLDWSTFELLVASNPVITDIMQGKEVTFDLDNIYLPDSISNLIGLQGHISNLCCNPFYFK